MKRVALMVAAFLLGHTASGEAATVFVPKSPELSEIQSKLQDANQTIEQIKLKREKLMAQLKSIETQYGATANSLHELSLQIGGKQQRLKHLSKEMKQRQAQLSLQNSELAKQVKAAFMMGKKEQLRLLLNQQDPALINRMLVYYDYLNKNRLKKLANIKENMAQLANLEQEKRHETDSLERSIDSQKTTQIGLLQTKKQREQLLLTLNQEFKEKSRQLGELAGDEKESQALIDRLQQAALEREKLEAVNAENKKAESAQLDTSNKLDADGNPLDTNSSAAEKATTLETEVKKPFVELKGHLPWPIKGPIVKRFGSPRFETRWDGVLIAAKEGTDIRAITSGRVVFADWLRGYGLLIIVDHSGGYMTLYAFNQSLYKKVGESVKAGTVIAAAGSSGGREESGLYFGIRNKGKPVDPASWCNK